MKRRQAKKILALTRSYDEVGHFRILYPCHTMNNAYAKLGMEARQYNAKNLRVSYRNCTVDTLRGASALGIIDDAWHTPGENVVPPKSPWDQAMDALCAAEDARVLAILNNIAAASEDPAKKVQFPSPNIKRVQFPGPYDGPLSNPPPMAEPVVPKLIEAIRKDQEAHMAAHPRKIVIPLIKDLSGMPDGMTKWIAENEPMTRGVEPGSVTYVNPQDRAPDEPSLCAYGRGLPQGVGRSKSMAETATEVLQMGLDRGTLMSATAADLRVIAREKKVKGVSAMTKPQLIDAIMATMGGV